MWKNSQGILDSFYLLQQEVRIILVLTIVLLICGNCFWFGIFFFCSLCYTINYLGLLPCMCIKLSTGSSTDDPPDTGNNLPSKDTAAIFQQKSKNT